MARPRVAGMEPVILHVGPVKTGSTFIQDLLWRYRDDLARQGVSHPCSHANEMWFAVNDVQDCAFIHFDFPECRGSWASIVDRVLDDPRPAILSHEVLSFSTEEHIARIASDLASRPVRLVVHARSLADMLPSTYQEKVKMVDPDISWHDWLDEQRATRAAWSDSSTIVARWARHVPAEQIHLVTVPPKASNPMVLLSRFADAAGIDTGTWRAEGAAANASLDIDQTEALRLINQLTADTMDMRERRNLVNRLVLPLLGTPDRGRRRQIDADHRPWIEPETQRRVTSLASSGVTLHGDLADLRCAEDIWTERPTAPDYERVAQLALQALIDQCTLTPQITGADLI